MTWVRARRGLVRRRLPVVLHRQAPVRGGPAPAGRRPGLRRRDRGRVPAVPARPRRGARHGDAGRRGLRPQVRRAGGGEPDHRPDDRPSPPARASSSTSTGPSGPTPATPIACSAGPSSTGPPAPRPTLKERLLRAYFVEGEDVGDPDVLVAAAAEVGLPEDGARARCSTTAPAPSELTEALRVRRRGRDHRRADVRHRRPLVDPRGAGPGHVRPGDQAPTRRSRRASP